MTPPPIHHGHVAGVAPGAIAVLTSRGDFVRSIAMPVREQNARTGPDARALVRFLEAAGVEFVFLTRTLLPAELATSKTFAMGIAVGTIEGGLAAAGIPYALAPPFQWREIDIERRDGSALSIAPTVWPSAPLFATAAQAQAALAGLGGLRAAERHRMLTNASQAAHSALVAA